MTKRKVHILSLNGGNFSSIVNALQNVGAEGIEVRSKEDLKNASHLILPGIGHYDRAMKHLSDNDLIATLKSVILDKQIPTLGICLGMHLLASKSDEGALPGLGIFEATVEKLLVNDSIRYKIPHNGWNTLINLQQCDLLNGISEEDEFFFLHKFHWKAATESDVYGSTAYESSFPTVIGKDNCWGVQFHPEKSHEAGLKLLKNFIQL